MSRFLLPLRTIRLSGAIPQLKTLAATTATQKLSLHTSASRSSSDMGLGSSILDSSHGQFVKEAIKSDCVVIFSKTTCGFCQMAKRVFQEMGVNYTAVELNQREDGDHIQDVLSEITGGTTVPRVFVNTKCIGGGTETRELHKKGKLLELVKQCQQSKAQANL